VKRIALAAAISLATFTVAALLWRFRGAALLFLISLALAAALRPLIETLEPMLGRTGALVIAYLSGLALGGVFVLVVSHGFLQELDAAAERAAAAYDQLAARPGQGEAGPLRRFLFGRLPPAAALYHALGAGRPALLLDQALGLTRNAIDVVGQVLITIALSAYWSSSREAFERLWLLLLPAPQRPRARDVGRAVEQAVGRHLASELAQSALTVLVLAVAFRLARLPMPMLPAIAAGLVRLVPFFGAPLAGTGAFLAGLPVGPGTGALAAGLTVLVVVALDRALARPLLDARRPSPTLTLFLAVAFVDGLGAGGLLLASTTALGVQVMLERLVVTHPRRARPAGSLEALEERLQQVRRRLSTIGGIDAAPLESVVARLDALSAEARRSTNV
jgi:predicted PurR-regulated permease PerM